MKNYVIPIGGATRLNERHAWLGPYSDTADGRELAAHVMQQYRDAGIACMVIQSETAPVLIEKPKSAPTRGLMADVLTGWSHSPNGGISARVRKVVILDDRLLEGDAAYDRYGEFVSKLWEPSENMPAVTLDQTLPGYIVALPGDPVPAGHVGYMASGAWIVSSDRRFRELTGSGRPIPLHDRTETNAQYRALSGD